MPPVPSDPATKADLAQIREGMATKADLAQIREEMATKADLEETKADLAQLRAENAVDHAQIRKEMATKADLLEAIAYLSAETARQIKASAEETRGWFVVLSDKIDAMNANFAARTEHDKLRTEFEQHRDDRRVHRMPAKRSTRSQPRRGRRRSDSTSRR
jgi:hypothetical protein